MNPFKIIRWKVLIVLALLGYAAHHFALPRYLDRMVTQRLEEQFKAEASVDSVTLSVIDGTMNVKGIRVPDPLDKSKYLLEAESADLEIDPMSLLTRKLVAKRVELHRPRLDARRPDAGPEDSSDWDLGDIDPKEVYDRAKDMYGKYEKAKDTWGKIRDTLAKLKAKREIEAEKRGELAILRKETLLPELGPRLIVEKVTIDGIDVAFDNISKLMPRLLDGKLEGKNITDKPEWSSIPMAFIAGAKFDDANTGPVFGLQALLGQNGERLNMSGLFERLDVNRIKEFVQDSLPVELIAGRISATWNGQFNGLDSMDLRPILVFEDLKIRAKPEINQLAGFLATDLTKEICDCGTFALTDLRVHGDLFNPQFDIGNTLSKLMQIGGKAFAEQYGKKMVENLLGQLSGRIPGAEGLVGLPLALLNGDKIDMNQALTQGLGSVFNMASGSKGQPLKFEDTFGNLMKGGVGGILGTPSGSGGTGLPGALGDILGGAKTGDQKSANPISNITDTLKGAVDPKNAGGTGAGGVGDLLKGVIGGEKPKESEKPKDDPNKKPEKPKNPAGDLLKGLIDQTTKPKEEKKKDEKKP